MVVETFKLWEETRRHLARLQAQVRNGNAAVEALQFGRFVQFSCIVKLCQSFDNSTWRGTPVDAGLLEWEANELCRSALEVLSAPPIGDRQAPGFVSTTARGGAL